MPDPLIGAARYIFNECLTDLKTNVGALPAEALNWKPAGDDTNSVFVLATHVMNSTRSWLSIAVGAPSPERDRDSEFRVSGGSQEEVATFLDAMGAQCLELLKNQDSVDWSAVRQTHARPGQAPDKIPAAFAIIHAIEHLREHCAHVGLTRQLWEARK